MQHITNKQQLQGDSPHNVTSIFLLARLQNKLGNIPLLTPDVRMALLTEWRITAFLDK